MNPDQESEKQKFPLEFSKIVAGRLLECFEPKVQRIAIAGSIRRGVDQVGDIELVYVPKVEASGLDLWQKPIGPWVDLIQAEIEALILTKVLDYRRNKNGSRMFGDLNKYLVSTSTGIPIDLFATPRENWGMTMVVRTGPKEFNIAMMQRFIELGMQGHIHGGITRGSELIQCPEESDVFKLLEWPELSPDRRHTLATAK